MCVDVCCVSMCRCCVCLLKTRQSHGGEEREMAVCRGRRSGKGKASFKIAGARCRVVLLLSDISIQVQQWSEEGLQKIETNNTEE